MALPGEKLAASLEILKSIQDHGITAIKASTIDRINRDRLKKNGFIKEVLKGWYIATPSNEQPGDSTSWYTSYWLFCAEFLADKYGDKYFIAPEQSLQIHAANWTVPSQLIVRTEKGTNHNTPLPFGTSLWNWQVLPPKNAEIVTVEGLRVMSLASALIYCSPAAFKTNPTELRTCLSMITDSSVLLNILLNGGHSTIAGRLAGAFRNIGKDKIADDIIKTMKAADYEIKETDPFDNKIPSSLIGREKSPYVNRIKLMWHEMRTTVIKHFPPSPGLPTNTEAYMKAVEDIYVMDAYHSLSIERYKVSPELIERVKNGTWNFRENENDKKQRDAMAARGYWQAAQQVQKSIMQILDGKNAGTVADNDHGDWYRELFAPSVTAGILPASDLAGYRNHQVYISNSMHVPINKDGVRDAMPALFELLTNETEASVRAVLGHFIFAFIHPYMDGNGRMARFLMNVMLASGGYPWTVIPVQLRNGYMNALESASVQRNIEPFATFLTNLVNEALKGRQVAEI
ncbi:MAG: Fic family protein [Bacteroidetes bacterium]|nr:Fic family protein [Bacteroidota bacterium]